MAKEFYTNGTGLSQTLNPSDESKIRIYDSKADADLDLANIAENEIVATKAGESEGVVEVVDTVEEDNPNAVSSGAVFDYVNNVENVYTYSNKVFINKMGRIYICTFQGATMDNINAALSALGITSQNPQIFTASRRTANNREVYPVSVVVSNGIANAWYSVDGVETHIGSTDIIYGQGILYSD